MTDLFCKKKKHRKKNNNQPVIDTKILDMYAFKINKNTYFCQLYLHTLGMSMFDQSCLKLTDPFH